MCGICGIISEHFHSHNFSEDINNMIAQISHRGPDEEGVYINKKIALGVKRLSIIDLYSGNQPISNEGETLWIVFNGEIYNFKELREGLIKGGHKFKTNTDTEVILHLYEEKNEDCLHRLNGMFAFAIWDEKKNLLFLARDRLGIKPLYYGYSDGKFVFASEIKSFFALKWFPKELDYIALDKYLSFEYVPCPYSIFKHIRKLPPGYYLIFKNGNPKIVKYWDINFHEPTIKNEQKCQEKLTYLLRDSVSKRMVADVPVGLFLSGGIDSSTIGYFMWEALNANLNTFSIKFKKSSFDESNYSNMFVRAFKTYHRSDFFDVNTFIKLLPKVVEILDEPFADPSFFPTLFLSRFSKEKIKVALSGEGGDELFLGYPTYFAHRIANIYSKLPNFIPKNLINNLMKNLPVSMENLSLDYKIKKFCSGLNFSPFKRNIIWLGAFSPEEKEKLYHLDFLSFIKKHPTFDIIPEIIKNCNSDNFLNRLQYLDIKTYLADDLLVKVDKASMACSQEVRVPFLEHNLVNFICSLPTEKKLRLFVTKYLLKRTMENFLPKEIVYRTKKGFGIPVSFWIKSELKNNFLELINDSAIKKLGIFNMNYVKTLLKHHLENKRDNRKQLWSLFMLELWCRNWLE